MTLRYRYLPGVAPGPGTGVEKDNYSPSLRIFSPYWLLVAPAGNCMTLRFRYLPGVAPGPGTGVEKDNYSPSLRIFSPYWLLVAPAGNCITLLYRYLPGLAPGPGTGVEKGNYSPLSTYLFKAEMINVSSLTDRHLGQRNHYWNRIQLTEKLVFTT